MILLDLDNAYVGSGIQVAHKYARSAADTFRSRAGRRE